jgi:hypothetical protein
MNRSIGLIGLCLALSMIFSTPSSAFAADAPALSATASEAEKEKIRAIVKEVMREYAASLGDKQGRGAAKGIMRNRGRATAISCAATARRISAISSMASIRAPRWSPVPIRVCIPTPWTPARTAICSWCAISATRSVPTKARWNTACTICIRRCC